jgi:hypothetical protein
MLKPVRLALDHLLDIVHGKDLQCHWKIVKIQQELCHVLELENVRELKPLQQQYQGASHSLGSDFSAPQLVYVRIQR